MTAMHATPTSEPIAVLGLGPMGTAIARSLSGAGEFVRAWNRTPRRLDGVDAAGRLEVVESPAEAVASARLIVICVRDHEASRAVIEAVAPAVGDAVVVNASTGTPAEAVESARRAAELGLRYVTAAIMVPTSMIGTEACSVLYAGASEDLRATQPLQRALGGATDVVGDDHAVPPALDLAMLDVYFAGMYAFFHAAALAAAHGIEPARFLPYAEGIADTLRGSLADLTSAIERRSYDGGDARLDMCLSFLDHVVTTSDGVGLDRGLAGMVRDASARAMAHWPGATDWDVVAEDFLGRPAR